MKENLVQAWGFENYMVSDLGNVYKKGKNGNLIPLSKTACNGSRHLYRVNLRKNDGKVASKLVHTLVYESFNNGKKSGTGVDGGVVFLNGNKKDCRLINLKPVDELMEFYRNNAGLNIVENEVPVLGHEDYVVNTDGEIFKVKNGQRKKIATNINHQGHKRVCLSRNKKIPLTRTAHSIIYESFFGKQNSAVLFVDGNKTNCSLENLISVDDLADFYNRYGQN